MFSSFGCAEEAQRPPAAERLQVNTGGKVTGDISPRDTATLCVTGTIGNCQTGALWRADTVLGLETADLPRRVVCPLRLKEAVTSGGQRPYAQFGTSNGGGRDRGRSPHGAICRWRLDGVRRAVPAL